MSKKPVDIINYPRTVNSPYLTDKNVYFTFKHEESWKNLLKVSYKLNEGSWQGRYTNISSSDNMTSFIIVPKTMFSTSNSVLTIKVESREYSSGNGPSYVGEHCHSILLQPPVGSDMPYYVSDFNYPESATVGQYCTINILGARDQTPTGSLFDVYISHSIIGRKQVATNITAIGNYSFIMPENFSLDTVNTVTIELVTKQRLNHVVFGTVYHSVSLSSKTSSSPSVPLPPTTTVTDPNVNSPKITFDSGYDLTITEGTNATITGTSKDIKDYMFIYAKQKCDVSKAVESYKGAEGFYGISNSTLKKNLLNNVSGNLQYYTIKNFDDTNSFITQDATNLNKFHIKTPDVGDNKNIKDFYALQWLKADPGDLIYLYAIERKWTDPIKEIITKSSIDIKIKDWWCTHCHLHQWKMWSRVHDWNQYFEANISQLSSYKSSIHKMSITLEVNMTASSAILYPPKIYVVSKKTSSTAGAVYLTSLTPGGSPRKSKFEYSVPASTILSFLNSGINKIYFYAHWGNNNDTSATYKDATLKVDIETKQTVVGPAAEGYYSYSDNNYNNLDKINKSKMTPYVVIPPAVRPLELKLKENTTKQVVVSYPNPLYGESTQSFAAYTKLGSASYDISSGVSNLDLSDLNPIDEVQVDKTLHLNINEKRNKTYEKKITLSNDLLTKIENTTSNNLYADFKIKSIDGNNLNFKNITTNNVKMQVMFSKNGNKKFRSIDLDSSVIDLKTSEYNINKVVFDKQAIIGNDCNTMHLLFNIEDYDQGKTFATQEWSMTVAPNRIEPKIGWRKYNNEFGQCTFTIDTFEVAKYALNYDNYIIRLCLENLSSSKALFKAPKIKVVSPKRDIEFDLTPDNSGTVKLGEDVYYNLTSSLFYVGFDDKLTFTMTPDQPYPVDLADIDFSNAFIEVIKLDSIDQIANKYSQGFNATIDIYEEKKQTTTSTISSFDPVQCIDLVMCCYDKNKNLINKASNKCRDIYHGRELLYYSDKRWHNFVNDKYIGNSKYKKEYTMTFNVPDGTEYMYFIAFCYSNWHDNPSIYSMSNILSIGTMLQDRDLKFINPITTYDDEKNIWYAHSDIANPSFELRLSSEKSGAISLSGNLNSGYNLAEDRFNKTKWESNPIIYSNTKTYGYELPRFNSSELYVQNNVVSSLEPLYNDIEYYAQWSALYGTDKVVTNSIQESISDSDAIEVESEYTIFEDEGDKFIFNKGVPYVDIPAKLMSYDRSKITMFLDTDFGLGNVSVKPTKLVTETYTENYKIEKINSTGKLKWGVKNLWSRKIMDAFEDIASIVDIKIEWGMKLNRDHLHPTEGRRGPILVENLSSHEGTIHYSYNPSTTYPDECGPAKIRDYGGHDIWHKNYQDYVYFEITTPRLKRLFLETNSHRRKHDAILFEDYPYDWCWEETVKVKYTVTRMVNEDGSSIYKKQNLPAIHYDGSTWWAGWATYSMPKFKADNMRFIEAPTESNPSFVMQYDVYLSPVVFYYKNNPISGDEKGNVYKYSWGDSADAYMKWETITVSGKAPYTHTQTHYYIAYEQQNTVFHTFKFDITKDGSIIPK